MKNSITFLLISMLLILGFNIKSHAQCENVSADFIYSDSCHSNTGNMLSAYFFPMTSGFTNPSYTWDYGNGSPLGQTQYGYNIYYNPGPYDVTLIVSDSTCADTITKSITFDYCVDTTDCGHNPQELYLYANDSCGTIFFDFQSTYENYWWNFGDTDDSTFIQDTLNWIPYPTYTYDNSGTYVVTVIGIDGNCADTSQQIITVDICDTTACVDLTTWTMPWIGYYQNYMNYVWFGWQNYSNIAADATVTINFPSGVNPSFDVWNTNNYSYTISGNQIILDMTLQPYSNYQDIIGFTVPTGVIDGTLHDYSINITPTNSQECSMYNNSDSLSFVVGNSYDPNSKSVNQPTIIDPDTQEEFEYKITFQNLGTAPAQDIYIIDTLSENLDLSTFQLVNSSHNVLVSDLPNGVKKFSFDGIWLPDSASSPSESIGYVSYKIKEKANNTEGSEIKNTAYIYFDQNPAIVTNTTYNINENPLRILSNKVTKLVLSPNPTDGMVNIISNTTMDKLEIYSIEGLLIKEIKVNKKKIAVQLHHLTPGLYLIKIKSGNEMVTRKLLKQ